MIKVRISKHWTAVWDEAHGWLVPGDPSAAVWLDAATEDWSPSGADPSLEYGLVRWLREDLGLDVEILEAEELDRPSAAEILRGVRP